MDRRRRRSPCPAGGSPLGSPAARRPEADTRRRSRAATPEPEPAVEPTPTAAPAEAPTPAEPPADPSPDASTEPAATPAATETPVDQPVVDEGEAIPAEGASWSPDLAAESLTEPAAAISPSGLKREVFGFLPYWEVSDSSTTLDYSKISTIAYFGVGAAANGSLEKKNKDGTTTTGWNGWTSADDDERHQQGPPEQDPRRADRAELRVVVRRLHEAEGAPRQQHRPSRRSPRTSRSRSATAAPMA